jgi:hypothetical protein
MELVAKRPFCEVTFTFFRMRDSKAFRAKLANGLRPLGRVLDSSAKSQEAPEKNWERTKRAFRHLDESPLNRYNHS